MTHAAGSSLARREEVASWLDLLAFQVLRHGLVRVIGWIGLMKFTAYEANTIQPFVAHSPLLGWMYHIFLIKDGVLLGAALQSLAESLSDSRLVAVPMS